MKISLIITIFIALLISCGTIDTNESSKGNVDLRVWIDPGPSIPSTRETNWTDLISIVISQESDTIIDTMSLQTEIALNNFTLSKVKSDIQHSIQVFTVDNIGDTIHGPISDTFTVSPGGTAIISMELFPIKGSIYLMLSHFPSYIDSIQFSFITPSQIFQTKERKSSKFYTSLDKVSFGLTGTLSIIGYDNINIERLNWSQENFTFTSNNVTLEADFLDIGSSNLEVIIHEPGKTLIWGIMNDTVAAVNEQFSADSQIIISEVMSSAGSGNNSADYLEIYNSSTTYDSLYFDSLQIITSNNRFTAYNIGIRKNECYVIGGIGVPNQNDWRIDQIINLDFTSTSEIITLKRNNNSLIDKVFYVSQGNYMGWPINGSSSKRSYILDTLFTGQSPDYNNYGSNWEKAESIIHVNHSDYFGTPGILGK